MKKLLLLISVTVLLFSCENDLVQEPDFIEKDSLSTIDSISSQKEHFKLLGLISGDAFTNNRIIDPNDPNLANWDWWGTNGSIQNAQVYYTNTAGSIVSQQVTLPWKTQGNVHNVVNPDVNPSKGWKLAYRDFGTATRGISFPFFALYNEFTGTMRFFFHNSQNISGTYFKANMSFNQSQHASSALSFVSDPNKSAIYNYSPTEVLSNISKASQFDSWLVFDFPMTSYDPSSSINNRINIDIYRVNVTSFESTQFTLQSYFPSNQVGGSSLVNDSYKVFSNFNDLRKGLKDSGSSSFNNILNSSYVQAIPIITAALGVIKSFVGNKNTFNPWTNVQFNGNLKLNSTNDAHIFTSTIVLKKEGGLTASYYQPIYPEKFGVMNVANVTNNGVAKITHTSYEDVYDPRNCEYDVSISFPLNFNLAINPDIDGSIISKRVKFVGGDYGVSSNWFTIPTNGNVTLSYSAYGAAFPFNYTFDYAIELVIKSNLTNDEYIYQKVYSFPTNLQITEVFNQQGNCGF
ncbi:hypothetical protein [Algoriphagus sp.]|uniref:hypothetical protein n=1 Tax=Algoriphagus sp. TaxID=1872435 RepID=UPI003F725555